MPSLGLHLIIILLSCLTAALGVNDNMRKKRTTMSLNLWYIISFVLVALFLASRAYLGRDWDNYYRIYSSVVQQDFAMGESRELGFLLLVRLLNSLGMEFHTFIEVTSIITVLLFFRAFKKEYALLPLAIFFFFVGQEYSAVINTIRQGIAVFCFLNALMYVDDEGKHSFLKYCCFIGLGALFHYSILVFFPFYWIAKWRVNFYVLLIFCIAVFSFCFFFLMDIYGDLLELIPKYYSYIGDDHVFAEDSTFGLGATLLLLLRLSPLVFYPAICKRYPHAQKYLFLFFIGISIYYSFYKFLLITRFTYYLQFCELFVFSFLIVYLWRKKNVMSLAFAFVYLSLTLFNFVYLFGDFLEDQLVRNNFSIMFIDFRYK